MTILFIIPQGRFTRAANRSGQAHGGPVRVAQLRSAGRLQQHLVDDGLVADRATLRLAPRPCDHLGVQANRHRAVLRRALGGATAILTLLAQLRGDRSSRLGYLSSTDS